MEFCSGPNLRVFTVLYTSAVRIFNCHTNIHQVFYDEATNGPSDTSERIYFTRICTPLNRTKQILAESQGNHAESAWKHCFNRMPIGISMTRTCSSHRTFLASHIPV